MTVFLPYRCLVPLYQHRFTKGPVRLLVAFDAVFETGKVIISDLKVHIRKSPVVSSKFQIVGVVVKDC